METITKTKHPFFVHFEVDNFLLKNKLVGALWWTNHILNEQLLNTVTRIFGVALVLFSYHLTDDIYANNFIPVGSQGGLIYQLFFFLIVCLLVLKRTKCP